jgi:hypothetical protein
MSKKSGNSGGNANHNNHSNQLNGNNSAYWSSRGTPAPRPAPSGGSGPKR